MERVMKEFRKLKYEEFHLNMRRNFPRGWQRTGTVPRESLVSPESFQTHLLQVTLVALDGLQKSLQILNIP